MIPFPAFIVLCIVSAFGVLGNIFIIGAVYTQKKLRMRSNAFIVNLAVADLIITTYVMPAGLVTSRLNRNPFGRDLCDFNAFLVMCTCGVSTQSLMMIALERYVYICKMHLSEKLFSGKLLAVYVCLTWVYSAAWTVHGWTGWTKFVYGEDVYLCIFDGTYSLSFDLCLTGFGMMLPMFVLIFCYFRIFRTVWTSRAAVSNKQYRDTLKTKRRENASDGSVEKALRQQERKRKREKRLAVMLFTVVVLFVVFWVTAAVVLPMSALWADMPRILYPISIWLALCNSSVNSIAYGALNKQFRKGYRAFWRRVFCIDQCRKRGAGHAQNEQQSSHSTSGKHHHSTDTISTRASHSRRRCNSRQSSSSNGSGKDVRCKAEQVQNAQTHQDDPQVPGDTTAEVAGARPVNTRLDVCAGNTSNDLKNDSSVQKSGDSAVLSPSVDSLSTPDSTSKTGGFYQYLHVYDETPQTGLYSSPILGATVVKRDGTMETLL